MNQRLKNLIEMIPLFKQMSSVDAAVCVFNTEGVVEAFFKDKDIGIDFEVGFQIEDKNDKIFEVIRTGIPSYNKVPKEVFGIAFEGTITPIFDGKEVVGVVTYTFSSEKREEIITSANELTTSISKTDESIEEIRSGSIKLAETMQKIQEITDKVKGHVDETTTVIASIQQNAKYSNILALNASIESARVGQAGQGFAVVAEEMRKFSKMSGDSAMKISENLEGIIKSLDEVRESIDTSTKVANEQKHSAHELTEVFGLVTKTAEKVTDICKKVSNI